MSGPRMGNMGQMNGGRRPNVSRMNYHDGRPNMSYQDHRQSYQEYRQSSHDGRPHDRPHSHEVRQYEHRLHDSRTFENRPPIVAQNQTHPPTHHHTQHDELIKYIYDSWSKVEMDRSSNNIVYYQEHENQQLKDFRPFNLEAFWGRRVHQSHQPQHSS